MRKLQGVGNSTFVLSVENDNDFIFLGILGLDYRKRARAKSVFFLFWNPKNFWGSKLKGLVILRDKGTGQGG